MTPRPSERHEFRRAARWFAALIVLVFSGDRALSVAFDHLVARSGLRFSRIYRGGLPSGVLVLGDSRGANAVFSPTASTKLGIPVFNLSYNGQSTAIQEIFLRDYLDHNAAPKLVLIEVTSVEDGDGLLSELKMYTGLSGRLAPAYESADPTAATAIRFFHLYRYDSELFLRCLYYLTRTDQTWGNFYTASPTLVAATVGEPPWRIATREDNLAALARMVTLLKVRGIPVRLFIAPYLPQHGAHLANLDAFVSLISARTGGALRVWSFANVIQNPSFFGDRIHLNVAGTDSLLDQMRRQGFFGTNPS